MRIAIVGAGFAGICMAIRLKRAGEKNFQIFEQAAGVGGVWRENTYPGAACDVESALYSYSFAPKTNWSRRYAPQLEILGYLRDCVRRFGLAPHLRLNTAVVDARYDEARALWCLTLKSGKTAEAEILVSAGGGLTKPAYPDVPGLRDFAGPSLHSSRWKADDGLDGKTVALIGTGASAIQLVPALAPRVGQLLVFQRTPAWVLPKADGDLAPRSAWRQRLRRLRVYCLLESSVPAFTRWPGAMAVLKRLSLRHLREQIPDAALRARLTPDYTPGCKRILWSNDFYPALRRDNVQLVTDAIREVRAHSLVTADGREHAVDALVLATGFRVTNAPLPFTVSGRGGRTLYQAWEGGAQAYLGTMTAGFPNLFFLVGPNTGLGHSSMIFMIESQVRYVLSALRTLRQRGARALDVKPERERAYNDALQAKLSRSVWTSGCASWYRSASGRITTLWPGFTFAFRWRTRRVRESDYELIH